MSSKRSNFDAQVNDDLKSAAKALLAGKTEEAVGICRQLREKHPNDVKILYAFAIGLTQSGMTEEAISMYREAIHLNPGFFEARVNLGTVLGSVGKFDEAIAEFSEAARLRPQQAEIFVNLSNAYRDSWRIDEAVAAAEKALALKPALAEAHLCLGAALSCQGHFDRAIAAYRDAIRIRPDFPAAHLNLGLAELVVGNFQKGWPEYEWRQRCATVLIPRQFVQPQWNGENPTGKTILLYAEQGFGDAIHFVRYAPLLANLGARVLLECPPSLLRLFCNVSGIDQIYPTGKVTGQFDFHCALPSLPAKFKTTLESIPANIPYLSAEPDKMESWKQKVARSGNLIQTGLAWAGSAENRNDRNRSIPPEKFAPLFTSDRFRFHSLQITPPPASAGLAVTDWSAHLKDFAETAGLIANLDLVISVDTAVAHLAAAMGKPVWLLIAFPPDWRWLLDRTDSPWYPTVRLFRQQQPGDWNGVIGAVAKAAAEFHL